MKIKCTIIIFIFIFINMYVLFAETPTLVKINSQGYDYVGLLSEQLIPVIEEGKGGYIDEKGNTKIPFNYDNVLAFSEGKAAVKKDGKYGVINNSNELIIPFEFEYISYFKHGVSAAKKDGRYGLIDDQGEFVTQNKYDHIVMDDIREPHLENYNDLINYIQPSILTDIYYSDSLLYLKNENFSDFFIVEEGNKYGYIDISGNEIIQPIYDGLSRIKDNFIIAKIEDTFGCLNTEGKIILPFQYQNIEYVGHDTFLVSNQNRQYLINSNNELLLESEKEKGLVYIGGGTLLSKSIFDKNEKLFDINGNLLFENPSGYSFLSATEDYIIFIDIKNGKKGIMDKNEQIILEPKYDNINLISDNNFLVSIDNKNFIVDSNGKTIKDFSKYTQMYNFSNGYSIAKNNEKYGIISLNDRIIVPFIYDKIQYCGNYYLCYLDNKIDIYKEGVNTENFKEASDWAKPYLDLAYNQSLIPEYVFNKSMNDNISRIELAKISIKLYEALYPENILIPINKTFTDTDDVDVLKAYNIGIIEGIGNDMFDPNRLITREEIAVVFSRFFVSKDQLNVSLYSDDEDISSWARDSIYILKNNNILSGIGNNQFAPKNYASIEEAITISYKCFNKLNA